MELEHLKRLREVNQDLLHRLRMMQEEMRKRLSSKPLFPASLPDRTATERSVPLPTGEKADQVDAGNSTADPAVLVSVEPGAYAARAALCSSLKRSSNNRGFQEQRVKMQEAVGLDSSFPDKDKDVMSVSAIMDTGHVPFQSDPEEYNVPVSSWSARPFLGYDWIAGLLETETSVAERSDQYFAELHEFRQANKEACVHEEHLEPKALDHIVPEQEPDLITSSHKCVYCYRLNQRLFTVPVDSESACPVCKIPRAHQPREEPAHVRVSIPRSTLLPAYKYKAHRRKSFELADNLALPSHCLAGWKNIPSSNPKLSSLDLRASLKEKPSHHACLTQEKQMELDKRRKHGSNRAAPRFNSNCLNSVNY